MDIFLNKTEDKLFDLAKVTANELNVEAYVIGGFVRDKLLNRNCKDIDIVCVGDGIKFAEKMSHLIPT
ncbi:MAG: tRNA nucleotidyltransferase, partial [Saprospiraceae bacterium]|nr:tRNA nucleotidyltransferase [Saprospiraceae bacterium]